MSQSGRIIIAILITLTSLTTTEASTTARRSTIETSVVSELTGTVIDVGESGEATFDHSLHEVSRSQEGQRQEDFWLEVGWSSIGISITDEYISPSDWSWGTYDNFVQGYTDAVELLGMDATTDLGWYLVRGNYYGTQQEVIYGEVYMPMGNDVHVDVRVQTHESTLLEDIMWIQNNLTIDGEHVFTETDIDGIAALVAGDSTEPLQVDHNFSSEVSDWSDFGLQSETHWSDPFSGVDVSWNGNAIVFPFNYVNAIQVSEARQVSQLVLYTPSSSGRIFVYVERNTTGQTPRDWENRWTSEEQLRERNSNYPAIDSRSNDTSASVIHSWTDTYSTVISIQDFHMLDTGEFVEITAWARPENIVEVYAVTLENLQLDGQQLEGMWSEAELNALFSTQDGELGEVSYPTQSLQASNDKRPRTNRASQGTSDNAVTSIVTGATLTIGSTDGEFFPEHYYLDDTPNHSVKSFTISVGSDYLDVIFIDEDTTPDDHQMIMSASFGSRYSYVERYEMEISTEQSWGLYSHSHYLDFRRVVLIDFQHGILDGKHIAIHVYGAESTFSETITWTQENVTINGESVLTDTNPGLIASMIDGKNGIQPEDISIRTTSVSDWAEDGLLSEAEWAGPIYGTSFSWDSDLWQFTYNRADAIEINHEYADEMLILETSNRKGMTKLRTMETIDTPARWVEWWLSDEYREADSGFNFTIIDSATTETTGSVILLFHTEFDEPVIVIRDVYINEDGVTVMTEVFAAPEDIAQVYTDFWDGVQSNGDYYPLTWTIEDIESLEVE